MTREEIIKNKANLSYANLRSADLSNADLREANLRNADLYEADLTNADLGGADLSDTDLSGANLSGADLSDTDLRGANLSGADLSNADLGGADLSECEGLRYSQISFDLLGEKGRLMTCVEIGGELMFFIGCFKGNEEELAEEIKERHEGNEFRIKSCFRAIGILRETIYFNI